MTLVTQCSADRLHAVRRQALRWGGDISLAVYVPSTPSSATEMVRTMLPPSLEWHSKCRRNGCVKIGRSPACVGCYKRSGPHGERFKLCSLGAEPENALSTKRGVQRERPPPLRHRHSRSRLNRHFTDNPNHSVVDKSSRFSLCFRVPTLFALCFTQTQTLREIQRLCDAINRAVRAADVDQFPRGGKSRLSLDVAILEGAEADPTRHDHCGPLYPVNTLRNLALLQVRRVLR